MIRALAAAVLAVAWAAGVAEAQTVPPGEAVEERQGAAGDPPAPSSAPAAPPAAAAAGSSAGATAPAPGSGAAGPGTAAGDGPAEAVLPPALAAVPPPVLDLHLAIAPCEDPAGALLSGHPPLVAALTPVAQLVAIACSGDAREAAYRLYVLETGEIGGIHALVFALPSKSLGWAGTDLLRSVALDGDGRLTGTMRDPGEGRCLSRGTWRWTGYAFALERAEIAEDCTGGGSSWTRVHPPAE